MGRLKAPPARLGSAPRRLGSVSQNNQGRASRPERAAGTDLHRLYGTKRWRDPKTGLRVRVLARFGNLCGFCQTALIGGRDKPNSAVIDHIQPHKGNVNLFWEESNLQALCKACHDGEKQKQDLASERTAHWAGG